MTKTNSAFRRNSKYLLLNALALLGVALAACVTVNVNFPESVVQRAADDYVRDLYKAKEKGKSGTPAGTPSTKPSASRSFSLISEAYAEEGVSFRANTPGALEIRSRQAARLDEIQSQKKAGVLGESKDGTLVLKKGDGLKPLLKQKIEKLVAAENKDREALYEEILSANNLGDSQKATIQRSFSRSFQGASPSGTWIESPEGEWNQKQ